MCCKCLPALVLWCFAIARSVAVGDEVGDAEREHVLQVFRSWTRSLAALPAVRFRFRSQYYQPDPSQQTTAEGLVNFDPEVGRIYLDYVEASPFLGAMPVHRIASWSGGEGLFVKFDGAASQQTVLKSSLAPKQLGAAHLPTDHPYFPGLRSLASVADGKRLLVVDKRRVPSQTGGWLYRVAMAWDDPSTGKAVSWDVFVVDAESASFLREILVYLRDVPQLAEGTVAVPAGLELPATFDARYLHLTKSIRRFVNVAGIDFPIAWEVCSPAQRLHAEIEIEPASVAVVKDRPGGEEDYRLRIPEGALVVDLDRRMSFQAGPGGEDLELLGAPEDVGPSEAEIDDSLRNAGIQALPARGPVRNVRVPAGCGAAVVYVTLSIVGKPSPLPAIASALGIRPGKPGATIRGIADYLRGSGLEGTVVARDPEVLRDVGVTPAILHERRTTGAGHFFAIRAYRDDDDSVELLDPPEDVRRVPVAQIAARWSSIALIVDGVAVERVISRVRARSLARWRFGVVGVLMVLTGASAWLISARGRNRTVARRTCHLLVGLLSAASYGCGTGHESNGVIVQGGARKDFGTIRDPSLPLSHSFVLENRTGRRQHISEIKKTCGCIETSVSSRDLSPGGTTVVSVSLDGKYVVGERRTTAFVVFDDPASTPVSLHLSAVVEPDFRVVVQPRFVAIPRGLAPGAELETRVLLTEFTTSLLEAQAASRVEPATGATASVVTLGPWSSLGWQYSGGYVRSAPLVLRVQAPRDWGGSSLASIPLMLEKDIGGDGDTSRVRSEFAITLTRS